MCSDRSRSLGDTSKQIIYEWDDPNPFGLPGFEHVDPTADIEPVVPDTITPIVVAFLAGTWVGAVLAVIIDTLLT